MCVVSCGAVLVCRFCGGFFSLVEKRVEPRAQRKIRGRRRRRMIVRVRISRFTVSGSVICAVKR